MLRKTIHEIVMPSTSSISAMYHKLPDLGSVGHCPVLFLYLRQWMDLSHRPQDDFCSVKGFILAVRDVLRIEPGGLAWFGHPCNLLPVCNLNFIIRIMQFPLFMFRLVLFVKLRFTWISTGTHFRHLSILGDERALVANLMLHDQFLSPSNTWNGNGSKEGDPETLCADWSKTCGITLFESEICPLHCFSNFHT